MISEFEAVLQVGAVSCMRSLTRRVWPADGDSLDPVARDRQRVLGDKPLSNVTHFGNGELAIVEFADDQEGALIKAVYRQSNEWILLSPNPVERLPPVVKPLSNVRAMWELRGVLFESSSND